VTFFLLIISMISAWKIFVPMFIMTPEGGPDNTTATVVYYLWEKGFRGTGLLGYAAAIAYILFVIILLLTVIQNVVLGKRVQYGD
jgi:multiple sugar transport system permease protein